MSGSAPGVTASLTLHPAGRAPAVESIQIGAARTPENTLFLRYTLVGDLGALVLPAAGAPMRTDDLWKHTCFEAFVRPDANAPGYVELNLAPSRKWAAYAFDDYRAGMRNADAIDASNIETSVTGRFYNLRAAIPLASLGERPWQVAITAVIETANGEKSYWSLAHAPGNPDFHNAAGFTLTL